MPMKIDSQKRNAFVQAVNVNFPELQKRFCILSKRMRKTASLPVDMGPLTTSVMMK